MHAAAVLSRQTARSNRGARVLPYFLTRTAVPVALRGSSWTSSWDTPCVSATLASRRFISRVGQTLNNPTDEPAHADEVVVETVRVPSGVTTITRKKPKPHVFVNADGYNVVDEPIHEDPLSSASAQIGELSDDPGVAEFTVTEGEHLEKLFRRPVVSHKYLSPAESTALTKMLFEACYKTDLNGTNREALMYQASLELIWLEEWADALLKDSQPPAEGTPCVHSAEDVRRLMKKSVLERVDLQKPLSYIIGSQPFFGCEILCRPPLLCPRPETEMWTHWLVSEHLSASLRHPREDGASLRVLDMCAGTGCIGVAIAKHMPTAEVISVDLLEAAVNVTRLNAARNDIPASRLQAIQSDLFEHFLEPTEAATTAATDRAKRQVKPAFQHTFDVIVSNPPYVLPEQYVNLPHTITHWESKTALVGDDVREHKQYLYFQDLCEYGAQLLKKPEQRHPSLRDAPNIVIEVGLQAHLVASLMEKSGWFTNVELHEDYARQERWVSATSL